jgi:hypothetical protein
MHQQRQAPPIQRPHHQQSTLSKSLLSGTLHSRRWILRLLQELSRKCRFRQREPHREILTRHSGITKDKCDPSAYTRMDDPQHVHRRDSDLHAFRQFNRTRSFTYGDAQTYSRAPVPGPPLAFAPSNISNERRDSRAVIHEEEDVHMASPKPKGGLPAFDSPDMGSDASPCARVVGNAGGSGSLFNGDNRQPIFGSTKHRTLGRTIGRSTFMRVASYAGTANPSQIQP